jgi:hypothetical protein
MNYDKVLPINLRVGDEFRDVGGERWYKVMRRPVPFGADEVVFIARMSLMDKTFDVVLRSDKKVVRRRKCCEFCNNSVSFGNGYKIGELYYCDQVCEGADKIMKEANGG